MPGEPGTTEVSGKFQARILALVVRIPPGRVMTYGQLALLAGRPGAARQAGHVMNGLMGGQDGAGAEVPWQRVINAQGRVSTHKLGFGDLQERLLSAEGIPFDASGRCDLVARQWWPEEDRDAPPEAPF
ncbi:MGMT family protein [Deinococcus sp. SM5_A1]|uniref:MGMT family protein n=1 Tax=Deinococcus sp. SM5_A1 TaxID=3379094 RepID=UPI00385868A3